MGLQFYSMLEEQMSEYHRNSSVQRNGLVDRCLQVALHSLVAVGSSRDFFVHSDKSFFFHGGQARRESFFRMTYQS